MQVTKDINSLIENPPKPTSEIVEVAPPQMCGLVQLSEGIAKVPIAKIGTFHHGKYGVVSFDHSDFQSIKDNFQSQTLGFSPYPTYGHPIDSNTNTTEQYLKAVEQTAVDDERKKGDVLDIQQEGDILYAITKPNEEALALLLSNEYEYSSGEFLRNYSDKSTGENKGTVLARFALTNSPFIPFNQSKIEMLSDQTTTRPESLSYFMVKLTDNNVEIPTDNMPEDTLISESTVVPSTVEATVETPSKDGFEMAAVIDTITSTIKAAYEDKHSLVTEAYASAKSSYEESINLLKADLAALQVQFSTQEAVTQKFSQTLSDSQKEASYQALAKSGVSPALIQRFSLIESAIEGGNQVIKLSDSEGKETESSVLEMVKTLLVDSVNSPAPVVEQLGQSLNQSTLQSELKKITGDYKAKAISLA